MGPAVVARYRTVELDGWEILVGKAARDNDALTFRVGRPTDLWLHASGYAGSHVIIRTAEPDEKTGEVPRHVVERAAALAAWHSKARDARGKVGVSVCRVADVSKRRGAPAGQVRIRNHETVRVYPRAADDA